MTTEIILLAAIIGLLALALLVIRTRIRTASAATRRAYYATGFVVVLIIAALLVYLFTSPPFTPTAQGQPSPSHAR